MFFNNQLSTPYKCLQYIKQRIKGGMDITETELSKVSREDIRGVRIGKGRERRDLMQRSLSQGNRNNVNLLSRYFNLWDYADYVKILSTDSQKIFHDILASQPPKITPGGGRS